MVSEGRNLTSLHLIVSYSNCSRKSSSCRGIQLHSNQLCHTKESPLHYFMHGTIKEQFD